MDVDAFVAVHRGEWDRLEQLSHKRRLSADEIDEFVELYQRTATHLSEVRSATVEPAVIGRLSRLLATSRAAMTGVSEPWQREMARFFTVSFPVAVWRTRWWSAAMAALTVVLALVVGFWVARNPNVQSAAFGSDEDMRRLVETDFANYYSEFSASGFAAKVWTNNAWIAAQCVAFGVFGLPVIYVIANNALNIGAVGGLMAAYGKLDLFFGLITPHGLLELTAVFIAAGAGLSLFWAWIAPGPRPRTQALAREGRAMFTVAMGLIVVLAISGVLEAFVTPSPLPTWARIAIGASVWLAFLAYVRHFGRHADAAGETGDLRADLIEDVLPTAG